MCIKLSSTCQHHLLWIVDNPSMVHPSSMILTHTLSTSGHIAEAEPEAEKTGGAGGMNSPKNPKTAPTTLALKKGSYRLN